MIVGILCIAAAVVIVFIFDGWWRLFISALLLAFGWPSIKTALFASDREIDELTGRKPVSKETEERFSDRI
jgi:hypothetical protein